MSKISGLKVNQLVEIEVMKDAEPEVYRSRVENISNSWIILGAPLVKGSPILLLPGTQIRVNYYDSQAVYTFEAEVISQSSGLKPTVTVSRPISIRRTQRRNFVRLDSKLPVSFVVINDELVEAGNPQRGTTLDISGGGIRFETSEHLPEGTVLDLNIELSGTGKVSALGKVVRAVASGNKGKNTYVIGVQFMIIEEKERDKIIRYIFDKQRELRQRGLL